MSIPAVSLGGPIGVVHPLQGLEVVKGISFKGFFPGSQTPHEGRDGMVLRPLIGPIDFETDRLLRLLCTAQGVLLGKNCVGVR